MEKTRTLRAHTPRPQILYTTVDSLTLLTDNNIVEFKYGELFQL